MTMTQHFHGPSNLGKLFNHDRISKNNLDLFCQKFPLIETYLDNEFDKRHFSSQIDLLLGFQIKKIEETLRTEALMLEPESFFNDWGPLLHGGAQTWVGLDFQILQCNYHDLFQLFKQIPLKANQKVIDLGAGYGRMGIFLNSYYPQVVFEGYELVHERVQEGNRIYQSLGVSRGKLFECDLSQIDELPEGNIYFIYDFGSEEHILKILNLLKNVPQGALIVKGQICRRIMEKYHIFSQEDAIALKKCPDMYLYHLQST